MESPAARMVVPGRAALGVTVAEPAVGMEAEAVAGVLREGGGTTWTTWTTRATRTTWQFEPTEATGAGRAPAPREEVRPDRLGFRW
ncbi:hypothetical protein ACIF80_21475 [Streptomyces sp. NPDC085927]|uniref:hypothetical protein n=1 Tax=Streptomyces sp. NPDC085927 TaxID=3365738 RepID=UPI0037D3B2B4